MKTNFQTKAISHTKAIFYMKTNFQTMAISYMKTNFQMKAIFRTTKEVKSTEEAKVKRPFDETFKTICLFYKTCIDFYSIILYIFELINFDENNATFYWKCLFNHIEMLANTGPLLSPEFLLYKYNLIK